MRSHEQIRADRRRLKQEYAQLFEDVSRIMVHHDQIGLISLGAPKDEYEPEVGTILPRLKEANSIDDVRRIIHQEFAFWFGNGTTGLESRYQAIAEDVWRMWNRSPAERQRD